MAQFLQSHGDVRHKRKAKCTSIIDKERAFNLWLRVDSNDSQYALKDSTKRDKQDKTVFCATH